MFRFNNGSGKLLKKYMRTNKKYVKTEKFNSMTDKKIQKNNLESNKKCLRNR